MEDDSQRSIDIPFSVPFVHRLRVTSDVSAADYAVLRDLLDGGDNGPARVLLVAEEALAQSNPHVERLSQRLCEDAGIDLIHQVQLPGGEAIKNSRNGVEVVLRAINDHDLDRRSYVVAIGGGAFLDAVGYAAAIAHRGVRLIRLPTTTLAQADSGVGVKNAVNYFGKKNWVGTFAVPWAVINDSGLLTTLPDRDFRSGFSEAVKVSLLKDADHFDWLCRHAESIADRDPEISARAIDRSCRLHLRHITQGGDPFETREARPLDFGHWSAHKLEPITRYQLRHGEAVAIGVAIDCLYSSLMLGFPLADAHRVCDCLAHLGLPLWDESVAPMERLLDGLEEFRQHLGGRLTITMLRGVGDPIDVNQIDRDKMTQAITMLHEITVAAK
ncbi:MAG: 3-dehydroquinate synthase [Planctomycetota bacterium]